MGAIEEIQHWWPAVAGTAGAAGGGLSYVRSLRKTELEISKLKREGKQQQALLLVATREETARYGAAIYGVVGLLVAGAMSFPFTSSRPVMMASAEMPQPTPMTQAVAPKPLASGNASRTVDEALAVADAASKAIVDANRKERHRSQVATSGSAKAKAKVEAKVRASAEAANEKGDPEASTGSTEREAAASDIFRKGYEAYLSGQVREGIRMMERADAMGAPNALARLCAIYRKPTEAEGRNLLKEANKCKGVD